MAASELQASSASLHARVLSEVSDMRGALAEQTASAATATAAAATPLQRHGSALKKIGFFRPLWAVLGRFEPFLVVFVMFGVVFRMEIFSDC